eukprot:452176-Rhodomonas_salina.2
MHGAELAMGGAGTRWSCRRWSRGTSTSLTRASTSVSPPHPPLFTGRSLSALEEGGLRRKMDEGGERRGGEEGDEEGEAKDGEAMQEEEPEGRGRHEREHRIGMAGRERVGRRARGIHTHVRCPSLPSSCTAPSFSLPSLSPFPIPPLPSPHSTPPYLLPLSSWLLPAPPSLSPLPAVLESKIVNAKDAEVSSYQPTRMLRDVRF